MTSSLTPVGEKYSRSGPFSKLFAALGLREGFPVVRGGGSFRPFSSPVSRVSESDTPSSSGSLWTGGWSFPVPGTSLVHKRSLSSRSESSSSNSL